MDKTDETLDFDTDLDEFETLDDEDDGEAFALWAGIWEVRTVDVAVDYGAICE